MMLRLVIEETHFMNDVFQNEQEQAEQVPNRLIIIVVEIII